jgi:uncharacterized membrane protein YbjE (DUF340 family)
MKGSLIILGFFIAGIFLGLQLWVPGIILKHDPSIYALYILIFFVGAGIGGDRNFIMIVRSFSIKYLLIPLTVILGTFLGIAAYLFFFPKEKVLESLAVGAGFGYYSLSSILISQLSGKAFGIIALLSNISREIFTLLFTPLLARYFGKLAPIICGGATSMDITLPVIVKYSGKEFAFISIFNGIILTILVPLLISFLYSLNI